MGLDVAFDRKQALAAGMIMSTQTNGTEEEIQQAEAGGSSADYVAWLKEGNDFVQLPGMSSWLHDGGVGEHVVVRANKHGAVYHPLTYWLKANNISWTEA